MNYYNEIDPYAAQWLRNLIAAGHLPEGEVDERSIVDVRLDDIARYSQCHFFAGIGGWPLALRLAGWPDDRPVWTGSCPCQPFSQIGQRRGTADPRHLWPTFHRLIGIARPSIVYGEQVASADGRVWASQLRIDMETMGYAVGVFDLCAASVGADHIRQRIYWVADAYVSGQYQWTPSGKQPLCDLGATNFWRENQPGPSPVADVVSARMGRVRGAGNAIVPALAAQFISAHQGW